MSRPRQVLPGQFYMLCRSCVQRQFLLRPDDVTNQTFAYCVAEAAQRYGIVLLLPLAMSNHHHTVLYDPNAMVVEFTAHFHKMVAKALNAHRGRSENLWSVEPPCPVRLADREAVMDKLLYTATNPVKDGLVARADEWPGFSGYQAFLSGEPIVVKRPAHFFRDDGPMPETVTLQLVIPEQLGDPEEVRAELKRRVTELEAKCAATRKRRVLGAAAIRKQSWRSCPASERKRGGIRPRVATRCTWRRIATLLSSKAFDAAYRAAYQAWRAGRPAVFPAGTYWLARFANVQVESAKKI